MLGEHLLAKEALEREQRRDSATARRLSGLRNGAAMSQSEAADAEAGLPPNPQPIDVTVRLQARAVIITGLEILRSLCCPPVPSNLLRAAQLPTYA